jgi:hypothetical protein
MRRSATDRQRDRARGVDRFGNQLPRAAGQNPRALQRASTGAVEPLERTATATVDGRDRASERDARSATAAAGPPAAGRAALPPHARLRRETVRRYACPGCGAETDEYCLNRDGSPRESNHLARVQLALDLIFGAAPATAGDSRQGPRMGDAVKSGGVSPRAQRAALDGSDQVGHDAPQRVNAGSHSTR